MAYRDCVFSLVLGLAACHAGAAAPSAPSSSSPSSAPSVAHADTHDVHGAHDAHDDGHGGHHPGHSWDDIYRDGKGFNAAPNKLLQAAVQGVAPGKALDIGMGQGRNAVFLARQGWDVTGVDTSAEGVRQAEAQAKAAGVALHGVVQDVAAFDMGRARWSLIAMIYMDDRALVERIKQALAPGGLVVIEFFHSDSNDYFPHPIHGFETGELERLFAGYTIVRSEVVQDVADFGERPAKLVRFVARKPA
jgi:SAM-dependent methyltransferase